MSGGINDTRCSEPQAGALECGEILYYQNSSSSRAPRTCDDICSSQTHEGKSMKCVPKCGLLFGSLDYGTGSLSGQAWYIETQFATDELVTIPDCNTAPAEMRSGRSLSDTRCCCITERDP